jgi:MFS family permease
MSTGVAVSYFSIQANFWILILTYGIVYGIGVGIAYIGPMACAMRWLPKWKGVASGIVLSGFGISSFLFTAVQTAYINPLNKEPDDAPYDFNPEEKYFSDPDLLDRVPNVFLILGGIYATLQIVTCPFIVNPPPLDNEYKPLKSNDDDKIDEDSYTPCQLFTFPSLYLVWMMFFCVGTCTSFITSLYKSFGFQNVTKDDHFLSTAGAVSSFFNLLGRILWGALGDTLSYKVAIVVQGAMATCILLTFYATSMGGNAMLFIWICAVYFCIGGYYSLYPSLVARLYGAKYFGINYGIFYTSQVAAAVLVSFTSQLLVDVVDWYGLFFIVGGLSFIEYISAILYCNKKYTN